MNGKFTRKALAVALGVAMGAGTLVGCSGGGGGSASQDTTLVGIFRDSPVSGLHFWAPSHHGFTDADGKFNYQDKDVVSFAIATDDGDPALKLGGATGKGVITPMDLMSAEADSPLVKAIARTLLQLDADQGKPGIQLNNLVASTLRGKMQDKGLGVVDFEQLSADLADDDPSNDDAVTSTVETLYNAVTATAVALELPQVVTYADAVDHLVNTDMFRKNVSKTPDLADNKSKLNQLDAYVPVKKANDQDYLPEELYDAENNCLIGAKLVGEEVCKVKPLVITYAGIDPRYAAGSMADAMAAVSRDDGATWKRVNLSRTGEKLVSVTDGQLTVNYKGETRKPVMMTKANYIVVTWSDKYCKGGSPAYSLKDPSSGLTINDDIFGVAGPQGLVDYTQDKTVDADRLQDAIRIAGALQVPYSCVWAARGWVDTTSGTITWSKAERLTSGRRDAYQLTVAGAEDAGFAITWQEDPNGLLAGGGDGPGDGFSGAAVNHQTDIWYSYVPWSLVADQADIDPALITDDVDDNPNDPILLAANDGDITGTPGENRIRLERFTVPVRVTDNAACNFQNLASDGHKWCRILTSDGSVKDLDTDDNGVIDPAFIALMSHDPYTTDPNTLPDGRIDMTALGMKYCDDLVWSNDVSVGWVCQTVEPSPSDVYDDRVKLDGDTGASRPNLFLQKYKKPDNSISAYAIMGYEETKGLGGGPTSVDVETIDEGKNVRYHTFDFMQPDVIASGNMVNLPERDRDNPETLLVSIPGDATHRTIYQTENARRVRFILQGKTAAMGTDLNGDGKLDGAGTVLIAIYKQGPEGKGRPSDIFARRMTIRKPDGTFKGSNPYLFDNFVCEETDAYGLCIKGAQNLSSVTPNPDGGLVPPESCGSGECYSKLVDWSWVVDNLDDESWETPMTEARAHRGQIRGDIVTFGYTWTPNWAASRMGNDKFDFYIRRSFDGGQNWTTDPANPAGAEHCKWVDPDPLVTGDQTLECVTIAAGEPEPPRNVSLLKNHKQSVIEPRIVAADGTLNCGTAPCTPEDLQNPNVFVASYGLANNVDEDGDGELEHSEQYPTDMYYSRSTDRGTTYFVVEYPTGDLRWDWLAKRADVEEGEAQLRLTPDGERMYATWLAESRSADVPLHFLGSDIWFRKIVEFPDLPAVDDAAADGTDSDPNADD